MEIKIIGTTVGVVDLPSANEMKLIADMENERIQEQYRQRELKQERELQKQTEQALPQIVEAIKEASLSGKYYVSMVWTAENPTFCGMSVKNYTAIMQKLAPILTELGYKVDPTIYYYSDSWQRRSGKIGYQSRVISWE